MKVKALTGFVLADGRSARTGEIIDVDSKVGHDLQKVGIVEVVVERAVRTPRKERRKKPIEPEVKPEEVKDGSDND